MLEPNDRRLLSEVLRAPAGHQLDQAIACTYSLDLVALAGVPLAMLELEPEVGEPSAGGSALAAMECVRRLIGRFTVFCQAGAVAVPREFRDVFLWLEGCVVEVSPRAERAVFHPKLWFVRFTDGQGGVRHRVVVLSRNLTYDQSWDVVVALDGELTDRRKGISENQPLADFLVALEGGVRHAHPLQSSHQERVRVFAEEIRLVRFAPTDDFDEWAFWPLGVAGRSYKAATLFSNTRGPFGKLIETARQHTGRKLLVVAPFVTKGFVDALVAGAVPASLVSKEETLDALGESLPATWMDKDKPRVWSFPGLEDRAESPLSGLHAKLWVGDDGNRAHVWLGSANATEAAFERNVECLLQVSGKKSVLGIDTLLPQSTVKGAQGIKELIRPYLVVTKDPTDEALLQRQRELSYGLQALAGGHSLLAEVAQHEPGWQLILRLTGKLNDKFTLSGRPVTLSENEAVTLRDPQDPDWSFGPLETHQLTEFWSITLRDAELEVSAVTRVPAMGMPEFNKRSSATLMRYLRDARSLSLYLEFLLAETPEQMQQALREHRRRHGSTTHQSGRSPRPLFESLLGALAASNDTLGQIDSLLASQPEGASPLHDDPAFRALWAAVLEARSRQETTP
jgi:hypothetical protein